MIYPQIEKTLMELEALISITIKKNIMKTILKIIMILGLVAPLMDLAGISDDLSNLATSYGIAKPLVYLVSVIISGTAYKILGTLELEQENIKRIEE